MARIKIEKYATRGTVLILAATFDLDGTLVDLERLHHAAHLQAAREVGVHLTWEQAFERLKHFIGGPDEQVVLEIASLSPDDVPPDIVLELKQRHFLSLLASTGWIAPRKGVRDILEYLMKRSVPLAVGTVMGRTLALRILDQAKLLPIFGEQYVVTGDDVAHLKPAPDIYLETAKRLGVESAHQLVFEDSVTGVLAGRSSGSCTLAVPGVALPTLQYQSFLQALADAGAKKIFSGWQDTNLLDFLEQVLSPSSTNQLSPLRSHGTETPP